ncbi:hypothetical protein VKT23_018748 [Stygiomarasmius scandens]|uniref:DUF6534 domain-containing protein n=1 Tax=Marasmiellus scandens TaxID=2682957 RepID=A0ABR1IQK6_9AGAR
MALLTNTYGFLFISLLLTIIVYGFVLLWGAQYFYAFPRDPLFVKIMVATFLIFGTLHAVTMFTFVYGKLVNHFGMFLELDPIPVTALIQLGAIFVLAFLSQCYFATRIWILSKKCYFMTAPILILAVFQLALGIWLDVRVGRLGYFTSIYKVKAMVIVLDSSTVLCDSMIVVELCYLLRRTRSGVQETDWLITRLVIAALNRGVLTTAMAIVVLVTYLYRPKQMIFELTLNPLGQTYILNVLSVLHSRRGLREKYSGSHSLSTIQRHESPNNNRPDHTSESSINHTVGNKVKRHSLPPESDVEAANGRKSIVTWGSSDKRPDTADSEMRNSITSQENAVFEAY